MVTYMGTFFSLFILKCYYVHFQLQGSLGTRIVYMLHITLLILSKGSVFQPAFGCVHVAYFDQLLGVRHT